MSQIMSQMCSHHHTHHARGGVEVESSSRHTLQNRSFRPSLPPLLKQRLSWKKRSGLRGFNCPRSRIHLLSHSRVHIQISNQDRKPTAPPFPSLLTMHPPPSRHLSFCIVFAFILCYFQSATSQPAPASPNLACGSFYQDMMCREDCGTVHPPAALQAFRNICARRHVWHRVLRFGIRHCNDRADIRANI
jgi:hypothetical protein